MENTIFTNENGLKRNNTEQFKIDIRHYLKSINQSIDQSIITPTTEAKAPPCISMSVSSAAGGRPIRIQHINYYLGFAFKIKACADKRVVFDMNSVFKCLVLLIYLISLTV